MYYLFTAYNVFCRTPPTSKTQTEEGGESEWRGEGGGRRAKAKQKRQLFTRQHSGHALSLKTALYPKSVIVVVLILRLLSRVND